MSWRSRYVTVTIVLFNSCRLVCCSLKCFFFKQKTAYEMRISDWSSDVCPSDLDQDQGEEDQEPGEGDPQATEMAGETAEGDEQGDEIGRASCRERVRQYV